jgi:uncharacterized BrkB/YihY/UPF0761 family membrane protein
VARTGETGQFSLVVERAVPNVFLRTFDRFTSINGQFYAAAISYFVVISLFPWLIFLVTLLALSRDPVLQAQVVNQIVSGPAEYQNVACSPMLRAAISRNRSSLCHSSSLG